MAIFRMRNQGERGIINDIPSYDLPPNAWSDGKNVRFEAGRIQKIGGWVPTILHEMPFSKDASGNTTIKTPLACTPRPLSEGLVYGTSDALYIAEGLHHTLASKDGATYTASNEERWEYTTLSNCVIFANQLNDPQGLKRRSDKFEDLPGWAIPKQASWDVTKVPPVLKPEAKPVDGGWKTRVIRAFKDHLVCLGMIEGGTDYLQRVRWSDVTQSDSLPPNWIEDYPQSDAGFNDLTDSFGEIIDARPWRDSLIIYTNRDTFAMDYVGGTLVFNFRKIFPDSGILSKNCVAEFEKGHFVISEDDIFVHDGSTRTPVASSRVKDHLLREITSTKYEATFVSVDTHHSEIWIYYVAPGGATDTGNEWACNKAAIWNWKYDTWTYADLPGVFDVAYHIPPDTDKRQWSEYGEINDKWDGGSHEQEHWKLSTNSFTNRRLLAASADSCFYILDDGYYATKVSWTGGTNSISPTYTIMKKPIVSELVRTGIDFDEQEEDISFNKCWRAVYPQMGGKGVVTFQVGGANDPWSAPTWDTTQEFTIGQDFRVDCWSNYKYNAIRIQDSSEGEWSFTGFDIDYFREGNR